MERDAFDRRSIHSLIVERASGIAIGTVRLILPDPESGEGSFPIQCICNDPLLSKITLSTAAEISRFAISKQMRRMAIGHLPKELRTWAVLGLMRAIVQTSRDYNITDLLAVMEPSLLRLLSRFGIYFASIGPLVEHHGLRQPCHANLERMLETIRQEHLDLWELLTESAAPWSAEMAS